MAEKTEQGGALSGTAPTSIKKVASSTPANERASFLQGEAGAKEMLAVVESVPVCIDPLSVVYFFFLLAALSFLYKHSFKTIIP
jgi:hypothetical protein